MKNLYSVIDYDVDCIGFYPIYGDDRFDWENCKYRLVEIVPDFVTEYFDSLVPDGVDTISFSFYTELDEFVIGWLDPDSDYILVEKSIDAPLGVWKWAKKSICYEGSDCKYPSYCFFAPEWK